MEVNIKNLSWAIFFSSIILGIIYFAMYGFGSKPKVNNIETNVAQVESEQITKLTYNPNIESTGWMVTWDWENGVKSLREHQTQFTTVSPVWYELNEDGTLKDLKSKVNTQEFDQIVRDNHIRLMPTIANFDHVLFDKILQNQASLDKHIESIVNVVVDQGYNGIDLDYESIELDDRDKFYEFLEKLSTKLHALNKQLSFTVIAKWTDDSHAYTILQQTRQVQEWDTIAKHVDELRIMTYDYTYVTARFPGPIGPIGWMESVLDYAITKVDPSKLVLGVHLYAYEWYIESDPSNEAEELLLDYKFNNGDNVYPNTHQARSYIYETVKKAINENQGEFMDYEGEKVFKYSKTNTSTNKLEKRALVYIDPSGVEARKELARKYGIKGVTYWRLGQEAELLK